MVELSRGDFYNRIIRKMSDADFDLIGPAFEPFELVYGEVLSLANEAMPYSIFPESGLISIVSMRNDGSRAEAGIIGRDGFALPTLVLGSSTTPNQLEVQIAGFGFRIASSLLEAAVAKSGSLQRHLLLYAHTLMVQANFTAMANAANTIDQRLARWLLMCHDRSESDDLALTHKFMGVMLSVRRASVTTSLQMLESLGLVKAERGFVTVTKRQALEDFAGEAYGVPETEYRRLFGSL